MSARCVHIRLGFVYYDLEMVERMMGMCAISNVLAELNVLPSASIEYLHAIYWLPNTPQPAVVLYGMHGIISIQVPNSTYYTAACTNHITLSPVCVAQ